MVKQNHFMAACILFVFIQTLKSGTAPKTEAPEYWSIAHANSIMARFPDPDNIPFKSWCYCQGVQKSYERYVNFPQRTNAKEVIGSFLWGTLFVEKPGPAPTRLKAMSTKGFVSADIGNPDLKGSTQIQKGGFDITAGGKDIWGPMGETGEFIHCSKWKCRKPFISGQL